MQEPQERQVQSLGWKDPLEEEMAAHSSHSCLENPMDRGAWRATVHGVTNSQTQRKQLTRTHAQSLSLIQFFVTPRTPARQAPLSMGFSRQKCWSGLPFPPPGDQGSNPCLLHLLALAGRFFTTEPPKKPIYLEYLPQTMVCRTQ